MSEELMKLECEAVVSAAKVALDMYLCGASDEALRALDRARSAAENLRKYPSHKRAVRKSLEAFDRVTDAVFERQDPSASNYNEYLEETPEEQAQRRLGAARRAVQRAGA
jgi:hypothetical protein